MSVILPSSYEINSWPAETRSMTPGYHSLYLITQ